jgi:hypothetical protein
LLPGRRIDLQLSFATHVVAVRASVLRCAVCQASVERIAYRGAVGFDRPLYWITDANGVAGGLVE